MNALTSALEKATAQAEKEQVIAVGNALPRTLSKLEFCQKWLQDHPEGKKLPGRELESKVKYSDGGTISYKTWNDAKK